MKWLLFFYLVFTSVFTGRVGWACLTKKDAPGAGAVGLVISTLGAILALAVII